MKNLFICVLTCIASSAFTQNQRAGVVQKTTISTKQWNQLSNDHSQLQKQLEEIKSQKSKVEALLQELQSHNQKMKSFATNLQIWEKQVDAAGGNSQSQLLQATKQMQETQMSFNLQYLQMQNQIQYQNRMFTSISNVMKTKHDTAKNIVNNIKQ